MAIQTEYIKVKSNEVYEFLDDDDDDANISRGERMSSKIRLETSYNNSYSSEKIGVALSDSAPPAPTRTINSSFPSLVPTPRSSITHINENYEALNDHLDIDSTETDFVQQNFGLLKHNETFYDNAYDCTPKPKHTAPPFGVDFSDFNKLNAHPVLSGRSQEYFNSYSTNDTIQNLYSPPHNENQIRQQNYIDAYTSNDLTVMHRTKLPHSLVSNKYKDGKIEHKPYIKQNISSSSVKTFRPTYPTYHQLQASTVCNTEPTEQYNTKSSHCALEKPLSSISRGLSYTTVPDPSQKHLASGINTQYVPCDALSHVTLPNLSYRQRQSFIVESNMLYNGHVSFCPSPCFFSPSNLILLPNSEKRIENQKRLNIKEEKKYVTSRLARNMTFAQPLIHLNKSGHETSAPTIEIRAVISGQKAGMIIGRQGSLITSLRQRSLCQISISHIEFKHSALSNRILTVKGHQSRVSFVLRELCCKILTPQEIMTRTTKIILIVPSALCGCIIGSKGLQIRYLRHHFKIRCHISSTVRDVQRYVTLSGEPIRVVNCLQVICSLLAKEYTAYEKHNTGRSNTIPTQKSIGMHPSYNMSYQSALRPIITPYVQDQNNVLLMTHTYCSPFSSTNPICK